MCGLVSIVGDMDAKSEKAFKQLLILDSLRGEDSTGVLGVAKHMEDSELIAKQVGDPFMLFDHKSFDKVVTHRTSRVLIGHNRYATKGVVNRINAHPFECGDIIGVHNGTLTNQYEIDKGNKFAVDSEALYNHVNEFGIDETIKKLKGAWALIFWDKADQTINYVRNEERPLWLAFTEDKKQLFTASEPWMINIAAGRNGFTCEKPWELAVDKLLSIPVPKGGHLGEPTVRDLERAPKVFNTYPQQSFPRGTTTTRTGTKRASQSKGKTNVVPFKEPTYDGSRLDTNFMGLRSVKLEAVAVMQDKHNADYMLCFCPEKPFYEIRLYRSIHTQVLSHPGCEFTAAISGFISVASGGAGYYKVSPHSTHIDTYPINDVVDQYPTHDGKYLPKAAWLQAYGTCAFCTTDVDPAGIAEGTVGLSQAGDAFCKECIENPQVNEYIQLVQL